MRTRTLARFVGLAALCAALGCALRGGPSPGPAPWGSWKTTLGGDRPGVGRIFEVATGREVTPEDLVRAATSHRYVLVGEKHDHPDHHRIQAWLVERIAAAGRRPVVAFEMFDPDQLEALHTHRSDPDELARAVRWDESGWPAWPLYRPLVAAVLAEGLDIVPANLSRSELARLREAGYTASSLGARLAADEIAELGREIDAAHCGAVPPEGIDGMVVVQIVKDARMAEVMREAPPDRGAVLIAGGGHVRRDRGVPVHLLAQGVEAQQIVVIGSMEVPRADEDASAGAIDFVERGAFDYVWLTPRVSNGDPCEVFRERLDRLRRR